MCFLRADRVDTVRETKARAQFLLSLTLMSVRVFLHSFNFQPSVAGPDNNNWFKYAIMKAYNVTTDIDHLFGPLGGIFYCDCVHGSELSECLLRMSLVPRDRTAISPINLERELQAQRILHT